MTPRYALLAALLSFSLCACSEGASRWTGTMHDSAGVTIVSNPEVGIWAPGKEWTFTEELRIGQVEGSPDYQFGDIGGVTADSRERIYVLDLLARHVKVFSPEGAFEHIVGGPGRGPGELRGPVSILMGPGDTLLVQDDGALRVNRYAPDGSSAGGFLMPLEERRPQAFKATEAGVMAEQFEFPDLPGQPEVDTSMDGIVRERTDGVVVDTLLTYPSLAARGVHPYAPEMAWDITEELELVCGVSEDYRIEIHADGTLERIIAKPFFRQPISDQEKEAVLDRMERAAAEAGATPSWLAMMRTSTQVGDFVPAFRRIVAGPEGTTWAQHVRPISDLLAEEEPDFNDPGAPEWDVFDSDGRFLGVVTMPPGFIPMDFRGNKIYGVLADELGVQYVVRLRVVGDLRLETLL
jgi:hypothetical protein